MRLWMILGGLIGFLIGTSFGLAQGSAWPDVIWRASIATVLGGVLLRWWGGVWVRSVQAFQRENLSNKLKPGAPTTGGKGQV